MPGWKATMRAAAATQRRQMREATQRQRELERRAKVSAKLSAMEQARLEVEEHENRLEVLLSIHKEQGEIWDWTSVATSLPPPCPQKNSWRELEAKQDTLILPPHAREAGEVAVEQARIQDEQAFHAAGEAYAKEHSEWERMTVLSRRILAGEAEAYGEAMNEFSPLTEMSDLNSSMDFTVDNPRLMECVLTVRGSQAIPTEVKTLMTSGKISVKAMPLTRFHEIYQDYVCGCMLRVAREVFALLPVETILVTASTTTFDAGTGHSLNKPVLSAAMRRDDLARLDFERLDPSDAIERFEHRGDFKASRKTGAFQAITPLTCADIAQPSIEDMGLGDLLVNVEKLRKELTSKQGELSPPNLCLS